MLYQLIVRVQDGDSNAALELVQKFTPLLRKYAYKLYVEDAYENLQCDFLGLLYSIDLNKFSDPNDMVLCEYISKSVYSYYVQHLKEYIKSKNVLNTSALNDTQIYEIEGKLATTEDESNILIDDLKKLLTEKEFIVIYHIYYMEATGVELAKTLETSRQNVNQIKKHALVKLRKHFMD